LGGTLQLTNDFVELENFTLNIPSNSVPFEVSNGTLLQMQVFFAAVVEVGGNREGLLYSTTDPDQFNSFQEIVNTLSIPSFLSDQFGNPVNNLSVSTFYLWSNVSAAIQQFEAQSLIFVTYCLVPGGSPNGLGHFPTLSFIYFPTFTVSSNITVQLSGSDQCGITTLQASLNGTNLIVPQPNTDISAIYSITIPTNNFPNGIYNFQATVGNADNLTTGVNSILTINNTNSQNVSSPLNGDELIGGILPLWAVIVIPCGGAVIITVVIVAIAVPLQKKRKAKKSIEAWDMENSKSSRALTSPS